MVSSSASVPTPNAASYIQRLCSHWRHKYDVRDIGATRLIDFGGGETCALAHTADTLLVTVTSDADGLEALELSVAEHINRFAFREGALHFDWQPGHGPSV